VRINIQRTDSRRIQGMGGMNRQQTAEWGMYEHTAEIKGWEGINRKHRVDGRYE
jgi:hypothetical protein